jgi:plasmid stabilization system protein ParE
LVRGPQDSQAPAVSLPVVFRDLAGQDVREAEAWYEAQVPGLGARFSSSLQLVVGLISEHPLACAAAYKNIRRALLPGFPYALFYLVLPERVRVLACLHQRRDPKFVRRRVSAPGGG